jgi:signal transduction protein with GAF and PtsI domain
VLLGRRRWFGSSRTLEGTAAAVLSILAFAFGITAAMHAINEAAFDGRMVIIEPVSERVHADGTAASLERGVRTHAH